MYAKELTQIANRIEKMKSEGKDEYDIRKMVGKIEFNFENKKNTNSIFAFILLKNEVYAESKMMGPDCIKRLTVAYEDLKQKLAV